MIKWLKRFHTVRLQNVDSKQGTILLFVFAFIDASFFPLPITTSFVVLAILNSSKAYKHALSSVAGTLAGGLTSYSIGHFAWLTEGGEFTDLAHFIFNNVPWFSEAIYNKLNALYLKWDLWILLLAANTPVPYNLFSVLSGVFNINIFLFSSVTIISQGIKFFLLAFLTIKSGPKVNRFLEYKSWKPVVIVFSVWILIIIAVISAI